ncbi:MAG: 1-deoxy-D-xylulose-5-phosphate synthase, partial [Clostridiales bacterium]|nr:1-deoxy-D-xylulose-5-phosphate synthase [Clostridiales bacterium]
SSAYGVACAMKAMNNKNFAVAVVGDGAMTGGMTYEGMNNAGKSDANLVVILNINEMSISKNVGGMAKYLSALRYKGSYLKTKSLVEQFLDRTPIIGKPLKAGLKKSKNAIKNAILDSTIFEEWGFEFIGPVDGHNIRNLEEALRAAKLKRRPVIVAVYTVKGKGYPPAEANPGGYHGVSSFELATGNPDVIQENSYSAIFGKYLTQLARRDTRICAVTAAMKYGTGLQYFYKEFPNRFFDVGIAEEHAVTFCGGLAVMGMIPVFAVYSTFLQRGYDQLIHDISISNTHAIICVDRAGIVGDDGETHNGIFDVPFLTTIPNITIYSPANNSELKLCLNKSIYNEAGLVVVRYPRGSDNTKPTRIEPNSSFVYTNNNSKTLVISYGRLINNVYSAGEILKEKGIDCDILKLVKIYPILDEVKNIVSKYNNVIFFEESEYQGSISQKFEAMFSTVKSYAINGFIKQATVQEVFEDLSFDVAGIVKIIEEI